MNDSVPTALDALADAIASRLLRGPQGGPRPAPFGPGGEPSPRLPGFDQGREELPELFPPARLTIEGLELTQSIQHYGTGYDADNAVPIVALKPMVVRAYPHVRPGLLAPDVLTGQRVTGELILSAWGREVYRTGPTRDEGGRLGPAGDLDRTLWDQDITAAWGGGGKDGFVTDFRVLRRNAPLNFRVPAWYLRAGRMTATVRLRSESGATAERSESFVILDAPAPKLALVRVNWRDSMGNVFAPTDADMLGATRLAERMLPFPYFETTILGVEESRSGDFATPGKPGSCNDAWDALLASLGVTRIFTALFQLGDIVFAFVPTAAKAGVSGTINAGCGGAEKGVGGAFVDRDFTFAHELGHIYGRDHVAVPNDPKNDPDYPRYGGDPRSIGEVGVEPDGATPLHDPADADDIMSYGATRWISPYTYRGILDARGLRQSAPADPRRVRIFLVIAFRLHRLVRGGNSVEIRSAHRIAAAGFVESTGRTASPVSVDLLDAKERILATHHCFPARSAAGCSCGGGGQVPEGREPWLDFQEAIELPTGEVATLSFHAGGEPFAMVAVGEPPRLEFEGPRRTDAGLELVLRRAHPRETPRAVVLFTGDDGASWVPVAFDPPDGEPFAIDPSRLSGGGQCRFKAVATAELQSAERESETFELPRTGRRLHLRLQTRDCAPGEVLLAAHVDARGLGAVSPGDVVWSSDREGELGRGFDLAARLVAGRHEIVARIPDGIGGTLEERGIIIVGGRPVEGIRG